MYLPIQLLETVTFCERSRAASLRYGWEPLQNEPFATDSGRLHETQEPIDSLGSNPLAKLGYVGR